MSEGSAKNPPTIEPTEVDWAKLAAFIDGEGCILINMHHKKYKDCGSMYLRVIVSNTDPRLPIWCRSRFGGRVHVKERPTGKHQRICFSWNVSCRAAARILEGCLPHFVIKREEAEIALAYQSTVRGAGHFLTRSLIEKRKELRDALRARKRNVHTLNPDDLVKGINNLIQ